MEAIQFFIDDSSIGIEPVSVLAGYMSTSTRWAAFNEEWARVLAQPPAIDYFKVKEALYYREQFSRFHTYQRDAKISSLVHVLNRHGFQGFSLQMPHGAFAPDKDDPDPALSSAFVADWAPPYFLMFYELMIKTLRHPFFEKAGLPIEFIFDNQPGKNEFVLDAWPYFIETAGQLRDLLKSPQFKDDKDALPLQAADMYAWYLRRDLAAGKNNANESLQKIGVRLPHQAFHFDLDPVFGQKLALMRATAAAKRRQAMRDENLLSAGHVVDNAAPGVRAIPTGYLFNKKHYKKRTKPKEM